MNIGIPKAFIILFGGISMKLEQLKLIFKSRKTKKEEQPNKSFIPNKAIPEFMPASRATADNHSFILLNTNQ